MERSFDNKRELDQFTMIISNRMTLFNFYCSKFKLYPTLRYPQAQMWCTILELILNLQKVVTKPNLQLILNFTKFYWNWYRLLCDLMYNLFFDYYTRHRDRIYLSEKRIREMVDQVGRDVSGVSETAMASLHIELQCCAPALDMFLSWCLSFYGSDVSFPPPISALFIALGKSSPVCALLPQLDSLEELYQKLINNEPVKQFPHDILLLQQSSPLLFDIISIMEGGQMPDVLCSLISDLLHKAKAPFGVNSLSDGVSQNTSHVHDLEYFPALPIVRSRGDYSFDAISANKKKKRSSRHPSLLPGIFLVHCQHGRT